MPLDVGLREAKQFFAREREYLSLLNEKYGSVDELYYAAKRIAFSIVNDYQRGRYEDNGNYWRINYLNTEICGNKADIFANWKKGGFIYNDVIGKKDFVNGKIVITLTIEADNTPEARSELESTIAHEILYCYQATLPKVKGVNEQSMTLYGYLLYFYRNAPTDFSQALFFGLYCCYDFEANANVAATWNYVENFLREKKKFNPTTEDIQEALFHYPKYKAYKTIKEALIGSNPTDIDKAYITNCMCQTFSNPIEPQKTERLYNRDTFSPDAFIDANKSIIIKICEKTLQRMRKNTTNIIEKSPQQ